MIDSLEQIAIAEGALNKVSQAENRMTVLYAADSVLRELWALRQVIEQEKLKG